MSDSRKIASVRIHPGIGIARVGNSTQDDGYYIGPEVTNPPRPEKMKDDTGALKRQAAQFRIYAYDKDGKVIREITADDRNTQIQWTVEVANRKSAWYQFIEALDLSAAPPAGRRNPNIKGEDRKELEITPKPKTISGTCEQGDKYKFDDGTFLGKEVYLGELRTDKHGRLIFLGGHGVSDSGYPDNPPASFGNNDGWHDDISDGPVRANVLIDGQEFEADEAWVVTAPPNYGTNLIGVKTMLDTMQDMFYGTTLQPYRALWRPFPSPISFTKHILPIFQQFSDAQWVNYGFAVQFGHDAPFDFTNRDFLKKLSRIIPLDEEEQEEETRPEEGIVLRQDLYQEFRRQIYNQFRQENTVPPVVSQWPSMYGDTVQLGSAPQDGDQYLAMTQTQLEILKKWVAGDFINDLKLPKASKGTHVNIPDLYHHTHKKIEEYPIEEQPGELDNAAMHFCLGGAFHPGCEMTWPMRNPTMYRNPFRIRGRSANNPVEDYGDELTHEKVVDEGGPLYFNAPGDITRWMAVPWQTDSSSCRSGYLPGYDPFLPTFWPARVPNHVLTKEHYKQVMDKKLSMKDRVRAFNKRAVWLRGLSGEYYDQIREMVTEFGTLGVVEPKDGPDDPEFPSVIYVETEVGYKEPDCLLHNLTTEYVPAPSEARYWKAREEADGAK